MRSRSKEWGPPPSGYRPGRHFFRRVAIFLFLLVFIAAIGGAIVATGLAAFSGINRWLVVGATAVGLAGFGLIARQLFRTTWAPLGELIEATRRLGDGDHSARLDTTRRGPFSQVANSFNKMAERLEDEDQRRRRLLADIGHELRTPMTVIRGEIEAVLDGLHDPSQLGEVVDEVELIERLLEDLRTLSMAEAGTLRLEKEPTEIGGLVASVLANFTEQANRQDVEVVLARSDEMPEVEIDPVRLQQVVSNLVRNALAQMQDGGRLEVVIVHNGQDVALKVVDSGPGIPEDELERIFERFVRASDSSGTGLGLSISRDLVEAHGGELKAANGKAGGAVFSVTIPVS